jgi:RHS repeat-associated protein
MTKLNGATIENYFAWNANNQLIGITDGTGLLTARFVYGSKTHVPDYVIKGSTKYHIVTDHLGSPVQVIDSTTGTIAQQITYDEFGNILSDTAPGFTPFGFAGCLYDVDTKLCRFGARDYDAGIGRWLSKDPILFGGGDTNLYGYVMQDPVNYIDPEGKRWAAVSFAVWVGGGLILAKIFMDKVFPGLIPDIIQPAYPKQTPKTPSGPPSGISNPSGLPSTPYPGGIPNFNPNGGSPRNSCG